ncbi:MAG: hypothetical protein ACLP7P_09630 [Rhodomicrobium sp.]
MTGKPSSKTPFTEFDGGREEAMRSIPQPDARARPGPWSFEPEYVSAERKLTTGKFIIRDAGQKFVCTVEGEANARLIADAASKMMKRKKPPEGDAGRDEALHSFPRPEPFEHPEGGYRYPETPVAAYPPTQRHPEGREARALDRVRGVIHYADAPPTPFEGQVVRVMPKAGLAEVAFIRRHQSKARRLPYYALQNLAANATGGRTVMPLDELQLRSRASRPVAPYLKAAARKAAPG